MKNFLIQESAISVMPQISKKNEHTVEFVAVLQEADKPNRNGRIYRRSVLEQALNAPYVQERIRTNSFYGEAGHPMDTSVQRQMTIDQRNIAFLIKEFWWEGNLLKGRLETANTAIGRDMKGLIEQGSRVAFSLRAQGNVHHDPMLNATVVESPIQIATYDWVVNPSHDKAFLESICEETVCGFFGTKQINNLVLAESLSLFENGNLISLNEVQESVVKDFAKTYSAKVKPLSEAYIFEEGDRLANADKVATVVNGNVTKKVVLEDFLLKDLRHRIARLNEELGEEAAEPVHSEEKPVEHTPEVENKDILPAEEHQQAEEIKPVVTEAELGDAAAEPVHSEEEPKEHTPELENKDVIPAEEHQQAEEVKEVVVESEEKKVELSDEDKKTKMVDASKEQLEKLIKATGSKQKPIVNPGVVKEGTEAHKEDEKLDDNGELVEVEDKVLPEVENGKVVLPDHDHAEEEGKEVRDALIVTEELGDAAAEPVHSDEEPKEHTPEVENKDVLPAEEHQQAEEIKEIVVESELGDAAAEPVHDESEPVEHTPEASNDDVIDGQHAEEIKEVVVESELGAAAAEPVHSDEKPEEHTPEASNDDVIEGQHAEEIKEIVVESKKIKLGNLKIKGGK